MTRGRPARAIVHGWAYRLLLRLYPRPFRDRFGRDMRDLFVDRVRRADRAQRAALWIRTLADAARHAPGARFDEWRDRRPDAARRACGGRRRPMETILRDLRYAARSLAADPAFTAVAILTLAIGIGATTAMFSIVDAALIRRLPYPAADRLVRLNDSVDGGRSSVSYPNFLDWRSVPSIELAAAFS